MKSPEKHINRDEIGFCLLFNDLSLCAKMHSSSSTFIFIGLCIIGVSASATVPADKLTEIVQLVFKKLSINSQHLTWGILIFFFDFLIQFKWILSIFHSRYDIEKQEVIELHFESEALPIKHVNVNDHSLPSKSELLSQHNIVANTTNNKND